MTANGHEDPPFAEPTAEDVAAIVALLQVQAIDPPKLELTSAWRQAGLREGTDRWAQPHRTSRLTKESS